MALVQETTLPWSIDYHFLVRIPAPSEIIDDEFIYNGGSMHPATSLRYDMFFDGVLRKIDSVAAINGAKALLTLRVVGVAEYDEPVYLELRVSKPQLGADDDEILAALVECVTQSLEIALPRWGEPKVERISDPKSESFVLCRLLSDPNDIVMSERL
jgi:hypothetical protein